MDPLTRDRAQGADFTRLPPPSTVLAADAAASEPSGLGSASLRKLERDLERDKPSAAALCHAATVLIVQGDIREAAAVLFWGLLKYPDRDGDEPHHALLKMRLALALQLMGDVDEALRLLHPDSMLHLPSQWSAEAVSAFRIATLAKAQTLDEADRQEWLSTTQVRIEQRLDELEGRHPRRNDVIDAWRAALAMTGFSRGGASLAQAAEDLQEVARPFDRFEALVWMRRFDEAFTVLEGALERGDFKCIRQAWRSPLLKDLEGHPLFASFVLRSQAEPLRDKRESLAVPDRMVYGRALSAGRYRRLAEGREHIARLQAELDRHWLAVPAQCLLSLGAMLKRCRRLDDADAVLAWACARHRQDPMIDSLKIARASVLIEHRRPAAARAVLGTVAQGGRGDRHRFLLLLACYHEARTPQSKEELYVALDRIVADPRSFSRSEEPGYDRDRLAAIQAGLLHELGGEPEAEETLATIEDPRARVSALLWMERKHEAMAQLRTLDATTFSWQCPEIFDLEGLPGWNEFLMDAAVAEMHSGDLRLNVPREMLGLTAAAALAARRPG